MSSHGRVYCSASIHRCRWANQGQKACFTKQEIHADESQRVHEGEVVERNANEHRAARERNERERMVVANWQPRFN